MQPMQSKNPETGDREWQMVEVSKQKNDERTKEADWEGGGGVFSFLFKM